MEAKNANGLPTWVRRAPGFLRDDRSHSCHPKILFKLVLVQQHRTMPQINIYALSKANLKAVLYCTVLLAV